MLRGRERVSGGGGEGSESGGGGDGERTAREAGKAGDTNRSKGTSLLVCRAAPRIRSAQRANGCEARRPLALLAICCGLLWVNNPQKARVGARCARKGIFCAYVCARACVIARACVCVRGSAHACARVGVRWRVFLWVSSSPSTKDPLCRCAVALTHVLCGTISDEIFELSFLSSSWLSYKF